MTEVTRTLVVWCADWPVVAAGVPLDQPAAVFHANRVVACSPAARAEGVERHQRRRDAQARCPDLVVLDHDPAAAARAFEPVPAALEALTPRIEITSPGACAFPTRGPSRYHGGDRALADRAGALVHEVLSGRAPVRVGVADGRFAAALAARRPVPPAAGPTAGPTAPPPDPTATPAGPVAPPGGPAAGLAAPPERSTVVAPGGSPRFLAPLPVTVLAEQEGPAGAELVDVLERLGVRTLGDLAALPVAQVVGRFGAEGRAAHRLARGLDERPPVTVPPPAEPTLSAEIDPPAERVEAVAFVARGLVDDLQARLSATGSACTRLVIGAETEQGETHERVWRTEGTFTTLAIADRVRWQLDGWLHAGAHRPSGGLSRLWLAPDEVVAAGGRQLAFSAGGPGSVDAVEAGDRAARALARVQGGRALARGRPRTGARRGARPSAARPGARRRRPPGARQRPGRGERRPGGGDGRQRPRGMPRAGRRLGGPVALRRALVGPGHPPAPGPAPGGDGGRRGLPADRRVGALVGRSHLRLNGTFVQGEEPGPVVSPGGGPRRRDDRAHGVR